MAYDATKPLDDGYLADAPAELREQHRALKDDKIVNAGKLNGYTQGNTSGKIPLNNGTLNVNLNADMLDGHDSAYFSADGHVHSGATTSANGFMTTTQVTKLNGIATGAEVNQNTFANVKVGSSTIQADAKQDTLELAAGNGMTLTADTTNDKVTIAVTPSTYLPLAGGTVTGAIGRKTTAVRGTAPSETLYHALIDVKDANNVRYGLIESAYYTTNASRIAIYAYNTTIGSGGNIGAITIGCDENGKVYTSAPTPSVSDDSTKIATTAYVKDCVPKSIGSVSVPVYTNSNGVVTACTSVKATSITTTDGTTNATRPVWFSYNGDNTKPVINTNFQYNPSTQTLTVGNINGFTIGKSVPSDAVFTDTHWTSHLYAGKSDGVAHAATTNGNTHLICTDNTTARNRVKITGTGGTTVTSDANGVITIHSTDTNTDTKVTATKITFPSSSTNYYLVASSSEATATEGVSKFGTNARLQVQAGTTSAEGASTIILGNSTAAGTAGNVTGSLILYNSSTKYGLLKAHAGDTTNRTVYLPKASGTLVCHTTDTEIGSATKPVYVSAAGVATACTYELKKTVPSDAVFTDTHYTSHLYAGANGGNAKSAQTNGNVCLNCVDNTTNRNSVLLKGTGSVSVTCNDGNGVTINGTNTTYTAGNGLALSSTKFRLAVPLCTCSTAAGTQAKVASVSSGTFELVAGALAMVKMSNSNTYDGSAGVTMNIGSTGAKTVYGSNLSNYVLLYYDGTYYRTVAVFNASVKSYYSCGDCNDNYCGDSE